jgi:hypothetical protein
MNVALTRRGLLASAATIALGRSAQAASAGVEVAISAGQSWRVNAFSSFAQFGIDPLPGRVLALQVVFGLGANRRLRALPNSSGIWIAGPITGITSYDPGDPVTIGRCATIAQQAFRRRAGLAQSPILEFCMAYPGSSWERGPKGGLKPGSQPWANGVTLISASEQLLPQPMFRSIGWTQGGSFNARSKMATIREFEAMTAAYDALELPGTSVRPLNFYIGMPGGTSLQDDLTQDAQFAGIAAFCRRNRNGRSWGTTPWYQWPFSGPGEKTYGDIHTGAYGTVRHGEIEGYAKFVVEDEKAAAYTPLWRSRERPIELTAPQVIKVPFDRPSGQAFRTARLSWCWDPMDGIAKADQFGWRVKTPSGFCDVQPSIDGLDVYLTASQAFARGQSLEISYAMHGPKGTNPGLHSACLGNLMMAGPDSVFFPGKTVNAWAWQFSELITI